MSPDKVLITGGAGFIGSHLTDRLLQDGFDVVIIDNLKSDQNKHINKNATFYEIDIGDPSIRSILKKEQPNFILHQAAQTSIQKSIRDPLEDINVNLLGTLNLLEGCRSSGIEKIIFASSGGSIYGNSNKTSANEENPLDPLAPYSASKVAIEGYLHAYNSAYNLPYTILRYSNVYGPRQNPYGEAGVIAIFTMAMLEGRKPVIFGTGEQKRDFIYVEDVVNANILAIKQKTSQIYNIGSGISTSINEIFTSLKMLLSYNETAEYMPARKGEVADINLDCSKASTNLNWNANISLEEGLEYCIRYFKDKLQ